MANQNIKNSLLASILADDVLWPEFTLPRVRLEIGPMPSDPTGLASWIFFPVDALITLSPVNSQQVAVAIVGQHGCVLPPQVQGTSMQARVMAAGQAYRMDWNAARDDPKRHAKWLRYSMAATQALISQIAQWAFCVQHHTSQQRLASWLLHCIAQSSKAELKVDISSLPLAIQRLLAPLQHDISQHGIYQDHGIYQPSHDLGFQIKDGCLRTTDPSLLRAQACSCYQKMAVVNA